MFIKSSHMLGIPSTLPHSPSLPGETLGPRGVSISLVAVGTVSEGHRKVVAFLLDLLGY